MNKWGIKLGFRRPNNKVEWAIWVGAGFILLAIINSLLFVQKPTEFPPHTFTAISVTSVLKELGFGIIASALLIGGLQRIKNNEKIKGYVVTLGSILMFLNLIAQPAILSVMLSNIQTDINKMSNTLIDKETINLKKKEISVADKSRFTKVIAKERYFKDGYISEYTDEKGETSRYQPTAEDIQGRKQFIFTQRLISIMRYEMVFWIIVFFINVTSYVLYCRRKSQT
jgi:hypothetical protein